MQPANDKSEAPDRTNIHALVLEDEANWQKLHRDMLEKRHCKYKITDDLEEAQQYIKENYVQLVIVDLDLSKAKKYEGKTVDESVKREGQQLVHMIEDLQWLDKTVVCIMSHVSELSNLAAFARRDIFEMDQMRPALQEGVMVNGVVYFSKSQYNNQDFWERIDKELREKKLFTSLRTKEESLVDLMAVRMTQNLIEHIESKEEHSRLADHDQWIRDIYQEDTGYEKLQHRLKAEIENLLLLSVNPRSTKVDLRRIGQGFSKAGVIRVAGKIKKAYGNEDIVKSGYQREIDNEWEAYSTYVRPFITRSPSAQRGPQLPILNSIIYEYVGESRSFESIYQDESQESINQLLDDLFKVACKRWYEGNVDEDELAVPHYMNYLHCYPERFAKPLASLEKSLEAQGANLHDERITLPQLGESFANPVHLLNDLTNFQTYPAAFGITHGDFNANNILVLTKGENFEAIMIDFARTGESHILRDFIQLEAVIKFVLLENATIEERYELERALLKQTRFQQIGSIRKSYQAQGKNKEELQRAFDTVCKIRELAWQVALNGNTNRPIDRFEQYHLGLFLLSVNTVRFLRSHRPNRDSVTDGISPVQALHALIAAGMLSDILVGVGSGRN